MIILDTNTIISCLEHGKTLGDHEIIVPDDLYEEYLITEIRHKSQVRNVRLASKMTGFSEAYYLHQYANAINSYSKVSVAKMRGLGDVSIIALLECLISDYGRKQPQISLGLGADLDEKITVVSNDDDLCKKINNDFSEFVEAISYEEYINSKTSAGH